MSLKVNPDGDIIRKEQRFVSFQAKIIEEWLANLLSFHGDYQLISVSIYGSFSAAPCVNKMKNSQTDKSQLFWHYSSLNWKRRRIGDFPSARLSLFDCIHSLFKAQDPFVSDIELRSTSTPRIIGSPETISYIHNCFRVLFPRNPFSFGFGFRIHLSICHKIPIRGEWTPKGTEEGRKLIFVTSRCRKVGAITTKSTFLEVLCLWLSTCLSVS